MKTPKNHVSWEASVRWLKSQPQQAELVRACFFDDPLCAAANRYFLSSEWKAVRSLVGPANGHALDVGSGMGISAYALAKEGWQTTALEPDPSPEVGAGAIRRLAAEAGLQINVVETWGEELPFEANSFDLIHCRQVLHHARDLRSLCLEAARVLKPNGIFIATREHVLSRAEDLKIFLDQHPLHHLYGGEHAFLLEDYISAITDSGIILTRIFNPMQSDINLYPRSMMDVKVSIARKLLLPSPHFVPTWLLSRRGRSMNNPGRLYSFFGRKAKL